TPCASPDAEIETFRAAFASLQRKLQRLEEDSRERLGQEKAAIFGAHALMLADPMFEGGILNLIEAGKTALDAIYDKTMEIRALFSSLPDPYLRERAADVEDVGRRLFREVQGSGDVDLNAPGRHILVAEELSPSEAAVLSPEHVAGVITCVGGATSHYAIIVSALEIPAVSGLESRLFYDGDRVICDGQSGVVVVSPTPATVGRYERKRTLFLKEKGDLASFAGKEAMTRDGHKIELRGNIALPEDAPGVLEHGGTGVGLFRTECLFMNRPQAPSEEEQYRAYKTVLENMKGLPTVIRTLDAGGDKQIPYLDELVGPEANPFLGLRAIRFCLRNKELFMTQLRALLRAGVAGDLRVMIPMISDVSQIQTAKEWLEEAGEALKREGVATGPYRLGIMIEIPSAALMAAELATEVDFFSVGTNDLVQYTLAVDRLNGRVADLYQPWHPAVVRLLKQIVDGAKAGDAEVAVCGEMAGDPLLLPLFVGLGFSGLSMSSVKLPWIKSRLSRIALPWAENLAREALSCKSASLVRQILERGAEELAE
ncbi:MAG: phosphoenolpyruvate--protein phosphotransferase, partial [Synergistaceae bacterium]|nr:phosphoenolpyruvate--protein phosphotransferase [Synergistaceae bacterium]